MTFHKQLQIYLQNTELTLQQNIQNILLLLPILYTTQTETNSSLPVSSSGGALDIADEMADRDRRKHNILAYYLTEGNDRKTHIILFEALSSDVFKLDVNIINWVQR